MKLLKVMGVGPEKILFVGDSDNDILTAQAAGMIPLGVTWGYGRLVTQPVEGMGELDWNTCTDSGLSIT